ncbi:MAG: zf-HC2 domain-containing protein [Planctomycetota bacterium]
MDCREVEKLLPLYVSGDVDEKEAAAEHLRLCRSCSALLETYRNNISMLKDLLEEESTPKALEGFCEKLMEKIETSGAKAQLRRSRIITTFIRAASIAALFLLAVLFLFDRNTPDRAAVRNLPPADKAGVVKVEELKTIEQLADEVYAPVKPVNYIEMEECKLLSELSGKLDF